MKRVHVPAAWQKRDYVAGRKEHSRIVTWHACHPEMVQAGEPTRHRARCGLRWCVVPEPVPFADVLNRCRRCVTLLDEDDAKHEGEGLERSMLVILRRALVEPSGSTSLVLQLPSVEDRDDLAACINYLRDH
jgi:hypothetical protein